MNEEANYRNYKINFKENVVIGLNSNFATHIRPTNYLREDEYANYIVKQIRDKVPNRDIEITENHCITINIGLHFKQLALSIRFYDLNDYHNERPDFIKDITPSVYTKIEKIIAQFIDDINKAKISFITFDENETIQIFDNKLYGFFYDLNTNQYVKPPQITLNFLQIDGIKEDTPIKERIEAFIGN